MRLLDGISGSDLKADLLSRFQEARDMLSRQFQSVMESVFQNLEESITENCYASTPIAATDGTSSSAACIDPGPSIHEENTVVATSSYLFILHILPIKLGSTFLCNIQFLK